MFLLQKNLLLRLVLTFINDESTGDALCILPTLEQIFNKKNINYNLNYNYNLKLCLRIC